MIISSNDRPLRVIPSDTLTKTVENHNLEQLNRLYNIAKYYKWAIFNRVDIINGPYISVKYQLYNIVIELCTRLYIHVYHVGAPSSALRAGPSTPGSGALEPR